MLLGVKRDASANICSLRYRDVLIESFLTLLLKLNSSARHACHAQSWCKLWLVSNCRSYHRRCGSQREDSSFWGDGHFRIRWNSSIYEESLGCCRNKADVHASMTLRYLNLSLLPAHTRREFMGQMKKKKHLDSAWVILHDGLQYDVWLETIQGDTLSQLHRVQ